MHRAQSPSFYGDFSVYKLYVGVYTGQATKNESGCVGSFSRQQLYAVRDSWEIFQFRSSSVTDNIYCQ